MAFLPNAIAEQIRALLPRYPSKQAVTLPALHMVHDELRSVPAEAIVEIAEILDLAPSEVHDTMSFYQFFRGPGDQPLGKSRLWVCRSLACQLRGGYDLLAYCSDKLGIGAGQTTADGKITLEFAECIGACEIAPCVLLNDERRGPLDVHEGASPQADKLIAELRAL